MLRVIVWMATVWFVLVFFAGCAQKEANWSDSQWVRTDQKQIADAEKAKMPPITSATYYTAGLLMENQGNVAGAVEKYNLAIELEPNSITMQNRLGLCYIKLREYDLATQTFKNAIEQSPRRAYLHNNLGYVYLLRGNLRAAQGEFQQALVLDPQFPRAHANMGIALTKQGYPDEALAHFMEAASAPAEAHYNLAMILHAEGQIDSARKHYQTAIEYDATFQAAVIGLDHLWHDQQTAQAQASALD